MELSSPRFKSFAVTAGISFWFFIFTSVAGIFSLEIFAVFVTGILIVTQIFSVKLSKGLDIFAIINTKIFLGILFVCVVSIYGLIFRVLRIDLLRLKKQTDTYWLTIENMHKSYVFKQY